MATDISRIAELAVKHPKLQTLMHCINAENLKEEHQRVKSGKAAGIDGVDKEEYGRDLDGRISDLLDRMRRQAYKPMAARRTYIPKDNTGKMRPLGIPTYEDKLVQGVMADILNAIYENDFLDFSYGFRPGRSCHTALRELNSIIQNKKVNYVVDADIRGFFDNVDHAWLMKFLEHRIQDVNFLRLVSRFLKAGIMEEGKYYRTDVGTPQGGVISPILANVYLHYALDLWFDRKVRKECRGECYMIRYADDFVCCFQYEDDATDFLKQMKERLAKFGLEIAEEKTRIIEFGRFAERDRQERKEGKPETFDFLGLTHYCGKSRDGRFRVKRMTSKKKFRSKVAKMKMWIRENMHTPINILITKLNRKLTGHYRYYGITDNSKKISQFYYIAGRQLYKTLKRRSQTNGWNWEKYERIINTYPIVKPKIYVSIFG